MGAGASFIDAEELTAALEEDFARVIPRTPRGSLELFQELELHHFLPHASRAQFEPATREQAGLARKQRHRALLGVN